MAKATSLRWRYFLTALQEVPLGELTADVLQQTPFRRWSGAGGWLLLSTGTLALLYWNGRLVVATGAGIAAMLLIYGMRDWRPRLPQAEIRRFLRDLNQPLVLAIAGGGLAALSTYLATSIWIESDSAWIAFGSLLQGAGTLGVLVLLGWHLLHQQVGRDRQTYEQLLAELTHPDALRRLVAVRQLISGLPQLSDRHPQRRELAGCFQLMLSREPEPVVRDAIMAGLQQLHHHNRQAPRRRSRALQPSQQQPLQPLVRQPQKTRSQRRIAAQ